MEKLEINTNGILVENSVLQQILIPELLDRGISLYIKRDDLIHPVISGNKWRKLNYNIQQAIHSKYIGVFTFGGAFSNHLVATAAVCQLSGLQSIGFVRGDELNTTSNETLKQCADYGMKLIFLSREMYALHNDKQFIDELKLDHPGFYAVPEGGANFYGIVGCQEIWKEIDLKVDHAFVAQGTTTTSCGLLLGKPENTSLHVIPVLKGFDAKKEMTNRIKWFLFDEEIATELVEQVHVHNQFHCEGYAKYDKDLLQFIVDFYRKTGIPLDPIYTGKAMRGMLEIISDPLFDNQTILFFHTGGIQGGKYIAEKEKVDLYPKSK